MVKVDTYVVKRSRKVEPYERKKLLRSIYKACLGVNTPEGEAETTALEVCRAVDKWLSKKLEVTSADIRRKTAEHLVAYNPDAAYMYKKQRRLA
jgi:transcriptional regulator NrdR family protein